MKRLNWYILIFFFPMILSAQNEDDPNALKVKNSVFFQYDINFEMLSVHYEKALFYSYNNYPYLISVGISHTRPGYNNLGYNWYGIPVWFTHVYGEKKNHLEMGVGYWFAGSYSSKAIEYFTSSYGNLLLYKAGYRFQKVAEKGLNLRLGVEPGYYIKWDNGYWSTDMIAGVYLSAGYSF